MAINAQVGRVNTSTEAFGSNPPYSGVEWRSTRNPDYLIYLFNLSRRTFEKVGRLNLTIPGVADTDPTTLFNPETKEEIQGKDNERHRLITSFPQPILVAKFDDLQNTIGYTETNAIRFLVDMLDPDNLTNSLDFEVKPENRLSYGTNLAEKGVFFSLTNPPTAIDLQKAVKRMEKYYNQLLEEAATLELTDKVKLSERLAGNPDYAYAADYFGKEVSWRKKQVRPVECPNCGEMKPTGRKFHVTSFGSLCVEQTVEAWKSAVNSGVKRYEDVPEDFRWKKEPKTPVTP